MSIVIPYHKELAIGGAFIKPNGEILRLNDNKHEEFAAYYCRGSNYNMTGALVGTSKPIIQELMARKDLLNARAGIDIFEGSQLTKKELEEYKLWLQKKDRDKKGLDVDFLVYVLALDKVERVLHDIITTTASEPHVRFFNYYLMNWNISLQNRLIFDPQNGTFRPQNDFIAMSTELDREAEEEIESIKAKVHIKERPYFFK